MERSQSLCSFEPNTCSKHKNNSNNNSNSASQLNLRKAMELRQNQLQQQQQKHCGSSENLKQSTTLAHYHSHATLMQQQHAQHHTQPHHTHTHIQPHHQAHTHTQPHHHQTHPHQRQRQQRLQRQHSTELLEDIDYTADIEEEEDDDERPSKTIDETVFYPNHQKHTTSTIERHLKHEESFDSSASTNADMSPLSRRHQFNALLRNNSIHSDSSRYSSVDSLLESRKPDPEAILINLGFGPVGSEDILSRIPRRFLKPSQVRGNDTDAFVKRIQLANTLADHSVLGYRGLTGNPDMPPSTIVAKIMERFKVHQRKKSESSEHTIQ